MTTNSPLHSSRLSLRVFSRALTAVLALAALAVTTRSLAQVPTFNAAIVNGTNSEPWNPPRPAAVGDFNGDGKLDALIVDGSARARFMRGNGDGSLSEINIDAAVMTTSNMVSLPANLAQFMPKGIDGYGAVKAADVNGDGKLDAICVTTVHINFGPYSLITVLTNTGNDGNGVPQFATTNYFLGFYDVRSLTVGDLNGDGKADFIVGSAYGGLYNYVNNGDGTFNRVQVTNLMPNVGGATGAGVIADLNGDGRADFVVVSNQAHATDIFFGNGDGTLQAPAVIPNDAIAVAVADMNGDGKPDLIEGFIDGSVSIFLNNGNGSFGSPASFPTVANSAVSGFFVSDVNGDGKLDVALSLYYAGKVAILTGNGDGTLGTPNLYGSIPNIVDVTLADFTNDHKPEIAAVSANGYGGQNYYVMTNTTPAAPPPLPTQTLTILGGVGNPGDVATNVEYFNPATGQWQSAFLADYNYPGGSTTGHPWGTIAGTSQWINYRTLGRSDPGAGPTTNQTLWYLYRVRFTVPLDAVNPKMTFSVKADNFAQIAINGVTTGGSTQFINNANVNNVIVGQADLLNADAVFSQAVHPGENTITLNVGDWGGANGFNFRIDLSMQSSQPLVVVPTVQPPVVASGSASGTYGSAFSYQISATNSPTTYSATGLPAGLSVNPSTGLISGTPTQATSSAVSVALSATNAGGTGTGTLTLTINKKSADITLGNLSQTYDGTAKSATATTTPANLAVTFNTGNSFTNAGTYPVVASITDANYTGSTSGNLVINKASSTTTTVGAGPFTYDGTTHAGGSGTVTGAGVISGSATLSYSGDQVGAGSYTVTASYAGDANHEPSTGSPVTIVINKANATINVAGYSGTYDGVAHGATGTATGVGGASVGILNLGATFTNAPGGTANWTFNGGANYSSTSGTASIVINKANATVVVTPYTAEYDGQPHSATVASITGVAGETGATVGTVTLNTTHTAVGTYADSWSFSGANYNSTGGSLTDKIVDTTAPTLTSVTPSSATLWPPNHQMVAITLTNVSSDLVGVTGYVVTATSSEPDNGLGDGDMPNDIQITGSGTLNPVVNLRAERSGTGSGRTYTITVQAKDAAGNLSAPKSTTVSTPKSQNGK